MRQGCLLLGPQAPQKASIEVQLQQFYKTVTELNANCQLKSFLVGEWPGEWWSEYTLDSWLLSRAQIFRPGTNSTTAQRLRSKRWVTWAQCNLANSHYWLTIVVVFGKEMHPAILRFCLSSLFSQGSLFFDLLAHARLVVDTTLEVTFDPPNSQLLLPTVWRLHVFCCQVMLSGLLNWTKPIRVA